MKERHRLQASFGKKFPNRVFFFNVSGVQEVKKKEARNFTSNYFVSPFFV